MAVRVGVDAGGTFTDVCLMYGDGTLAVFKISSSPREPDRAITNGVESILQQEEVAAGDVGYFGHGTTVATNALLEQRGSPTGIITTQGFRDLLELGRQQRPHLYDLQADKPTPLVRRRDRNEVTERVLSTGEVQNPLNLDEVRAAIRALKMNGIESLAVCFLYSYLYPDHEDQVAAIVAEEFPDAFLSLSHDVVAEFREYERLSTTVVNSYVGPIMSGYVRRLRDRIRELGITAHPYITQSNGGIISVDVAASVPVRTILSGPAAGVVGAGVVARAAGFPNIITFDMGGTSTDVALVQNGEAPMKLEQEVAGYPMRTPMLDINTVGAGGGSLAWIDSGGHLKVGPQSAGADPGPACYGKGGTDATVTDANVRLGILSRKALLGGSMPIDASAADAAVLKLAEQLHLTSEEIGQGILDLAVVNMARAIRVVSIERGHDPREYALVAFGGAGPLHASRLARELDIPQILVPTIPGLLSAYGLLVADMRTDFSRTQYLPAQPESIDAINQGFVDLEKSAGEWFAFEGIPAENQQMRRIADMRYVGQNYELSVVMPEQPLSESNLTEILSAFHQAHDQAYGFAAADEPAQFVTLRLEATGDVATQELQRIAAGGTAEDALVGHRNAFLPEAGGWTDVPLYDRTKLTASVEIDGPAIVEQMDSTTLVLPGQRTTVDAYGNLIIAELNQEGRS